MKNNLNKVFNRFVTGLLTITVLGACGQDTNDISLNDDDKNQEAKSEMGSRTNSVQIQTRNVSYAEKSNPIEALKARIANIETTIANLVTKVGDNTNAIDDNAAEIGALKFENETLKARVANLEAKNGETSAQREAEMVYNVKRDLSELSGLGGAVVGVEMTSDNAGNQMMFIRTSGQYTFNNTYVQAKAIIEKHTGKTIDRFSNDANTTGVFGYSMMHWVAKFK